ncbi:hypothetical protein NQ315_000212 [Exocentrus adspersus]|uniref:Uncharacterized protein n=1 Tax=Exocentrus adspersus TaxID=1586481 RepID=A0AAV8VQN9_9CUCU|nr:hypothetical protein NQ315_000212 [Exocentrus adspersus]
MALRNIKITREIAQTCNKLRAISNCELCTLPPHQTPGTIRTGKYLNSLTNNSKKDAEKKILPEINVTEHLKTPSLDLTGTGKNLPLGLSNKHLTGSSPFTTSTRFYSTKKKKDDSCKLVKKCQKNLPCPRFVTRNCEQSKGSNCKREYIEPCCTKKLAPYPSYSELCAFRLEDDLSECQQCPWQKCGGVDDIKPQKKHYHTSTRQFNMAMIPGSFDSNTTPPLITNHECSCKDPCKEPPPKCPERLRKEKEKEKCEQDKKKKKKDKKCSEANPTAAETWVISGSMRNLDMQRYYFNQLKVEQLKQEIGEPSTVAERVAYHFKDCPKKNDKCPKRTIKPPVVDHTIQEKYRPKDPCCEDAKKGRQPRKRPKIFLLPLLAKEHDKGHPPPCEEKPVGKGRHCPEDADKKKKLRKERDLYDPAYRRYPLPYHDSEGKIP